MLIPIVGDGGRIVGWTSEVPEYQGVSLRHEEAEALLSRPIACTYVEIEAPADAQRAGAPLGWNGPWRCLALCNADAVGAGRGASEFGTKVAGEAGSRGTARRIDY
jgi:hypothetical protein